MKQIDNRGESRFFSAMYRSIFQSADSKVAIPTNRSRLEGGMKAFLLFCSTVWICVVIVWTVGELIGVIG